MSCPCPRENDEKPWNEVGRKQRFGWGRIGSADAKFMAFRFASRTAPRRIGTTENYRLWNRLKKRAFDETLSRGRFLG